MTADDRVLQFSSPSFDASVEELVAAFSTGATLIVQDERFDLSPVRFTEWCRQRRVTVLDLPTAYWHELVDAGTSAALAACPDLRLVCIGGEAAAPDRARRWQTEAGSRVRLFNGYGPSECTITATWTDLTETQLGDTVPVGRPVARGVGATPPPPLRVQPVRYERDLPRVKHVGLFGTLHARRRAQLAGADDALFHDAVGLVSEGPTWNVGFILDGQLVWPDAEVLPGVTMALLRQSGHDHVTAPVTVEQALTAEAAFAANTAVGARAIAGIAGTGLATDHPLLKELQRSYLSTEGDVL
ncbi:aminotransferase class IV [Streptomyces sp. NPDC001606]